ncbi:hypothetical protein RKD39_001936 [Streptomyces albogriseolus]
MGQGHRSRPCRPRAAAHECLHAGRVVRGAVGGGVDQRTARRQQARHRVHGRHLQGRLAVQRRQDGRHPLREHRLAGAGRSLQEKVVPARRGHLDRRARRVLAHDIGEVVPLVAPAGTAAHAGDPSAAEVAQPRHQRIGPLRLEGLLVGHRLVGEDRDELAQAAHAQHGHARHQSGLGGGALRYHHLLEACVRRGQHGRQDAPYRPHPAVQPQLADHHDVGQDPGVDPLRGAEDRTGHGQVETAAGLGHRRRAQSDGELLLRPLAAGVDHGGPDPVAALREALVRQPHQRERGDSRLQVGLHLDDHALDADEGHRARTGESHVRPPP